MCRGDEALTNYVLDWIASAYFQRVGEPLRKALFIVSDQQDAEVFKDILMECIGSHNVMKVKSLTDCMKVNTGIDQRAILYVEEANMKSAQVQNYFKNLHHKHTQNIFTTIHLSSVLELYNSTLPPTSPPQN